MASDSRLTISAQVSAPGSESSGEPQAQHLAVAYSDSHFKTFLAPNNVGISVCGDSTTKGEPLAGFVESFIANELEGKTYGVDDVPPKLNKFFGGLSLPVNSQFHVAGYRTLESGIKEQAIWAVFPKNGKIQQLNEVGGQGASWSGEGDILARLLQPVKATVANSQVVDLPFFPVVWQFFTLQDGIDFVRFAIGATRDSMRFQARPKTVGGAVDILVLRPSEAFWVQRKELI